MKANSEESHAVSAALKAFNTLINTTCVKSSVEYLEQLNIIKTECDKGMQYKVLAGKQGAYGILLDALTKLDTDSEVTKTCFKTLISLMSKQPDLLDERGVQTIIDFLDKSKDQEIQRLVLKWVKECCILHEMNRQKIFDAGILDHLKPLLDEAQAPLLRDVLGVLRALVLDDDVRVEFGRAHDHAKAIASDTLTQIISLLSSKDFLWVLL